MSKTQFRPKVEIEPYNSKLTNCGVGRQHTNPALQNQGH